MLYLVIIILPHTMHALQVDAVVLKLTPMVKPRIIADYHMLEAMVKAFFQFRRKYIRKGAKWVLSTISCERKIPKFVTSILIMAVKLVR